MLSRSAFVAVSSLIHNGNESEHEYTKMLHVIRFVCQRRFFQILKGCQARSLSCDAKSPVADWGVTAIADDLTDHSFLLGLGQAETDSALAALKKSPCDKFNELSLAVFKDFCTLGKSKLKQFERPGVFDEEVWKV